jgi:sugar phosphate permease
LWTASLFFGCAGLGATGLWTPVITLVQRWFAFHRRGFALGILSVGYGLGFATMGVAFPWVVEHFNWRYAWFFLGALALAMVAVNGVFLRSDPAGSGVQPWGTKKEIPSPVDSQKTFREQVQTGSFLMNSRFWLIGFSYFAIAYSLYGITTFMVDYAKYQLNLPLEQSSLLATIHGLGQIVGVLTVLPLSDYLGRKKTILISNSAITACLAAILVTGGSWVLLCIFIGCLAVFFGATFPIYGACAGDYFPRQVMGTIIGAWTPFYGSGGILAHWVTGMLRDATGIYNHAFLINVLMGAAAVLLISLVRKKSES